MGNFLQLDGLALTPAQGKWKRAADTVAREVLRPNADRVDREGEFPKGNIQALRDKGLLSLLVPEECGGAGESVLTAVVVTESIAKGCAATAMAYRMHQTTIPVMCATATPDQVESI